MTDARSATYSIGRTDAWTIALFAFLVGATLVFVTGFAQSDVLHNVAHDTRHALSFPCH